ncbi:hypothetical protein AAF712_014450 [Marasmius tenuissimus]|uniref:AB hydrolase-1 domain-containing protein n=1 Tax=Marasmius tenuissimus TaxID=585030 RepID=A0ABR2ZD72_9AGAR
MRFSISSLVAGAITLVSLPFTPVASAAAAPGLSKRDFLDPTNYKNLTTSRGITYNYYFSPPANNDKRYLLFVHGWPGFSYDYRFQVDFFREAGYGLIVPDLLGFGKTDKPIDPEEYKSSLISRDIVDILTRNPSTTTLSRLGTTVLARGAKVVARLGNYFPERFFAFGFLAVGNLGPSFFETPYSVAVNLTKAVLGYENFGYWDFFARPGAHEIIEDQLESLFSLVHTANAVELINILVPAGRVGGLGDGRPEVGIQCLDPGDIPPENIVVKKPVFFGAALQDFVAIAPVQIKATLDTSANSTIHLYNAGHWVHWEAKDEVNRDLLSWVEGLE